MFRSSREPKLAANALRNAVREMERRLKVLAAKGVRNLDQYNKLFESDTPSLFEQEGDEKPLPQIVIIIDELADLMMLDQSNVEESITPLGADGAGCRHTFRFLQRSVRQLM